MSPTSAYIWRGNLTEGFSITSLVGLYLQGLIHGGACFWNFTVLYLISRLINNNYWQPWADMALLYK